MYRVLTSFFIQNITGFVKVNIKFNILLYICLTSYKLIIIKLSLYFIFLDFLCIVLIPFVVYLKYDFSKDIVEKILDELDYGLVIAKKDLEIFYANLASFNMLNIKAKDLQELQSVLVKEYGYDIGLKEKRNDIDQSPGCQSSSTEFLRELRATKKKLKILGKK